MPVTINPLFFKFQEWYESDPNERRPSTQKGWAEQNKLEYFLVNQWSKKIRDSKRELTSEEEVEALVTKLKNIALGSNPPSEIVKIYAKMIGAIPEKAEDVREDKELTADDYYAIIRESDKILASFDREKADRFSNRLNVQEKSALLPGRVGVDTE